MTRRQGAEVERCRSVSTIQRMIGGKWKIEILFYVALKDVRHFGQLRRCIGTISESTLSKQLRELVDDDFLERRDFGEVPPRVEYTLTAQGESFVPILLAMKEWGEHELGL
ncbi:MAG: helix-turn-helix domain-containing protein [Coriobacteriales bacterium]